MNDGSVVNVEVQKSKQIKFHKRSYFYNSRIYSILLRIGKDHEKLPKTFMINIINFNLHKLDKYHTKFIFCEETYKEYEMADITETHYIDLTVFREKLKKGKIDLNDPKDRITLLFYVEAPQNLINKVIKMDSFAKEIQNNTTRILQDKKEYLAYIRAEQVELDRKGQIRYAEEKGLKKGKEKGLKIGEKKGKKEEKIEIATKLKKLDFPLEQIAEITELPLAEIKKL